MSQQGIHYQYIKTPDKPTVVLAHPLGMNLHVWDYLVPDLSTHFSVLRFDLPGHGQSSPYGKEISTLADSRLLAD